MTTINNYVKGNFLIAEQQEQTQFCLFESEYYNETACSDLFHHSLQLNLAESNRNVILLDFGLSWMAEFPTCSKSIQTEAGNICEIGQNKLGIFFFDSFCSNKKDFALPFSTDALNKVLAMLKELQKQLKDKRVILFVRGLEVLEIFYQKEDVSLFVASLLQINTSIKQINMLVRKSLISAKLEEALTSLASCKIFFDYPFEQVKNNVHTAFFMIKLTLRKFNGYSFISSYKLNSQEMKKGKLDVQKHDPKTEEAPAPTEQDLQKMFQTSFSLSISESQKRAKLNMEEVIMPHLQQKKLEKWDNCAEKNKNKMGDLDELIQLEGSDVDQEQEDDEDFDV